MAERHVTSGYRVADPRYGYRGARLLLPSPWFRAPHSPEPNLDHTFYPLSSDVVIYFFPSLSLYFSLFLSLTLCPYRFLSGSYTLSQRERRVIKVTYSLAHLLVSLDTRDVTKRPTFSLSPSFYPLLPDGGYSSHKYAVADAVTSLKYVDCFHSCRRQEIGSHTRDSLFFSVTPHSLLFT